MLIKISYYDSNFLLHKRANKTNKTIIEPTIQAGIYTRLWT